ncbi:phytanoyl-CoA dioxygenase family protein [Paraglaciecola arctica]|uniref:phytanoyl-CoA dioxygenase family protein n=1 Tax=Paraglaciecola arctica TaxID=1128911 RepID=UPI001C07B70F|nr:phytanoyl-CoA dioxygenase family protein [Paraglaciecola arctica]MBU3003803.1 phytanoyl-CoA dioxygenase family protein [Paraglaciecola arctica]
MVSLDIQKSIDACAAHYGEQASQMKQYLLEGQKKALELENRGPIKFDNHGNLHSDILETYSKYGFYIFENVMEQDEIDDIKADLDELKRRFPVASDAKLNSYNEPGLGTDCKAPNLLWAKPLGDPLGGTPIANGRHQVKLFEPKAADDAPSESPFVLLGSLQFSEACLRAYGHPQLLKIAEQINGEDFAPFHECLFIKEPGLGAAVSWHQDGDTHWDAANFNETIHGFNFMAQVYGSTAVNGVWVIPGTHKLGRIDIKKLVADAGSERLPNAVPLICNPGDVIICNRQIVHGSFANTGFEPRITVNFGFHRRSSVLNVKGAGIHAEPAVFDEKFIEKRSMAIGYAIDARHQRYPNETPYTYKPLANKDIVLKWNNESIEQMKDYNLMDLSI